MGRRLLWQRTRRRMLWIGAALLVSMALGACGGANRSEGRPGTTGPGVDQVVTHPLAQSGAEKGAAGGSAQALIIPAGRREDRQGSVEIAVTPLGEQSAQSGRLIFEVAMNTHSVDLSMDLTHLATLETDTGLFMTAVSWSGGSGHHVVGLLEFELPTGDEAIRLAEAQVWRLTVRNVDAELRVFEWSRNPGP